MIVRHGSGENHEQSSVSKGDETIDLTEEIIPEAPQLPVDTIAEQIDTVLVHVFIYNNFNDYNFFYNILLE